MSEVPGRCLQKKVWTHITTKVQIHPPEITDPAKHNGVWPLVSSTWDLIVQYTLRPTVFLYKAWIPRYPDVVQQFSSARMKNSPRLTGSRVLRAIPY